LHVQTKVHDRLALLTDDSMGRRSHRERVPDLQSTYDPVLKRIQFLAEQGLMSLMMLSDFLSQRIAPLQKCAHDWSLVVGQTWV
jgi:hypothetical protein